VYGPPSTATRPELGLASPTRIRSVVDFPAPFGPRNPVTVPGLTVKETSVTTC